MTGRCFISLAEIPGIRRQLKSARVVLNKLTERELKSCALQASGSLHPHEDELDFHAKCEVNEPKKKKQRLEYRSLSHTSNTDSPKFSNLKRKQNFQTYIKDQTKTTQTQIKNNKFLATPGSASEIPLDLKDEVLITKKEKETQKTQKILKRKPRNSEAMDRKWSVEKGKTCSDEEGIGPVKRLRLKISSRSNESSIADSKSCIPMLDEPLNTEILPDNSTCISDVDLSSISLGKQSVLNDPIQQSQNEFDDVTSEAQSSRSHESNLLEQENNPYMRRTVYSPISEASSPKPSSNSIADISNLARLFQRRLELLKNIEALKVENSVLEEKQKATTNSLKQTQVLAESLTKHLNDTIINDRRGKDLEIEIRETKRRLDALHDEISSINDTELVSNETLYKSKVEAYRITCAKLEEIKNSIDSHKNSVEYCSIRERIATKQKKMIALKKDLAVLNERISSSQSKESSLQKELELIKIEINNEWAKRNQFYSEIENEISVVFSSTGFLLEQTQNNSYSIEERPPSPDSQTAESSPPHPPSPPVSGERKLRSLNISSPEVPVAPTGIHTKNNLGESIIYLRSPNIIATATSNPACGEKQLQPETSTDDNLCSSTTITFAQPSPNYAIPVGNTVERNSVINRHYPVEDLQKYIEGYLDSLETSSEKKDKSDKEEIAHEEVEAKQLKQDGLFSEEAKSQFSRLVAYVLRSLPETNENILLQRDLVISLIQYEMWPKLYEQLQETKPYLKSVDFSVFKEDLEKIEASGSSATISVSVGLTDYFEIPYKPIPESNYSPAQRKDPPAQKKINVVHHHQMEPVNVDARVLHSFQDNNHHTQSAKVNIQRRETLPTRRPTICNETNGAQRLEDEVTILDFQNNSQSSSIIPTSQNDRHKKFAYPVSRMSMLRSMLDSPVVSQQSGNTTLSQQSGNDSSVLQPVFPAAESSVINLTLRDFQAQVCVICRKQAYHVCNACLLTTYCSQDCQRLHWAAHRHFCKRKS
ncbi:uncharacterized protein LOC136028042 [Artemia franciscana]|uniref:MYND-type domain-containing protein n=1 Tax=Artemia franciscana TaxID=6661 RepID=A0AA88HGN8_ARTSF|nr:hypothetical protein QYM36_014450 [Artemia franciscana]